MFFLSLVRLLLWAWFGDIWCLFILCVFTTDFSFLIVLLQVWCLYICWLWFIYILAHVHLALRDTETWLLVSFTNIYFQVFFLPMSNLIMTCFRDDSIFAWEVETLNCKYQLPVPAGSSPQYRSFAASRSTLCFPWEKDWFLLETNTRDTYFTRDKCLFY